MGTCSIVNNKKPEEQIWLGSGYIFLCTYIGGRTFRVEEMLFSCFFCYLGGYKQQTILYKYIIQKACLCSSSTNVNGQRE